MNILPRDTAETARAYAVRVLLFNIVCLELPPGSAISENELSAALGLSRTPIREALIELSRIGLVEIFPQRGSFISRIDGSLIEESRFMRLVLEVAVLKQLCEEISEPALLSLNENLGQARRCLAEQRTRDFFDLDNQFHRLLFEAAGRSWTYGVIHTHMVHFDRLRALSVKGTDNTRLIRDHEDFLYAICRHDSELAEILMTRHLNRYQENYERLREEYPDYFKD